MKWLDSAPTAGPEERSCCRSVLLMNYDTKLHDLKKCQVKRISQTQLIRLSVTTGREMDRLPILLFTPYFVMLWRTEHLFLWGLLITKNQQK